MTRLIQSSILWHCIASEWHQDCVISLPPNEENGACRVNPRHVATLTKTEKRKDSAHETD